MKKKKIIFGPLFLLGTMILVTTNNVFAEKAEEKVDATFEIIENPEGTLRVEATPLTFGAHKIVPTDINAKATVNSNIKVTEFSGAKKGWKLEVQMNQFKDKNDSTIVAKDVKLFYPKVTPVSGMTGDQSAYAPTIFGTDTSFLDSIQGTIVDDSNTPVLLAEAVTGKGFGDWTLPYDNVNNTLVQIKIPAGQKIGNYKSELLYTASNTP